MHKTKKVFLIIFGVLSVALACLLYLSILRNTESRYLKILDFPRLQLFVATLICLVLVIILTSKWKWYNYLIIAFVSGGLVSNGSYLMNYTPLVATAVPTATEIDGFQDQISILLTNVKMENRESKAILDLIDQHQPDVILAMEVDSWWDTQLQPLKKVYPYSIHTVNDVAYGMVLLSKIPLTNLNVEYLQHPDVPSFEGLLQLKSGKVVRLHCLHPVPPTHFDDLPDNAGEQEVALKKLGKKLKNEPLPTIVAGDLNDVVWSYTDELTQTNNILSDVRVGRGFYNSYNAENIFMRWPLDHVFVTKEFQLESIERLPAMGSDHYPILVRLVL